MYVCDPVYQAYSLLDKHLNCRISCLILLTQINLNFFFPMSLDDYSTIELSYVLKALLEVVICCAIVLGILFHWKFQWNLMELVETWWLHHVLQKLSACLSSLLLSCQHGVSTLKEGSSSFWSILIHDVTPQIKECGCSLESVPAPIHIMCLLHNDALSLKMGFCMSAS